MPKRMLIITIFYFVLVSCKNYVCADTLSLYILKITLISKGVDSGPKYHILKPTLPYSGGRALGYIIPKS